MHLTNYAVNKNNPKFVFNTSESNMGVGHKRSLSSVMKYFENLGKDVKKLKSKIKDLIVKTLVTGMPLIGHQYKYCQPEEYSGNMCFHILGFDVMLNSEFEPVLLEVNHTPSFTTDTPLDQHIKYKLIKDTLILMNINTKTKQQLFQKAKECNSERLHTGRRRIYEGLEKDREIQRSQQERD
jgi:tubulin polyglutamylase TTLL6/13